MSYPSIWAIYMSARRAWRGKAWRWNIQLWLGQDWPTTGQNVNVIIQWVVLATQSDWTMVWSSLGDNSHEAQLAMLDQEIQSGANLRCTKICGAMDPTVFFHISIIPVPSFLCGSPFFFYLSSSIQAHAATVKPGQHMCLITSFELQIRPWSVLLT